MAAKSGIAAAMLLAVMPVAATASGGADVVDDSEVETSGHCHLEAWASDFPMGGSLVNLGPACTPARVPWLEIDGFLNHYDPVRGRAARTIGFGPKINLRPSASGLGLGMEGTVSVDASRGGVAYVVANLPLTLPVGPRWTFNANAGAQYVRGVHGLGVTAGVQAVWQPPKGPQLMAETFVVGGGPVGQQVHARWTVDRGRIDIDVMASRYPDGVSRHALTLGFTIRR